METQMTDWHDTSSLVPERPSADFIRAVAELLETNADDLLAEMGYVPAEPIAAERELAVA